MPYNNSNAADWCAMTDRYVMELVINNNMSAQQRTTNATVIQRCLTATSCPGYTVSTMVVKNKVIPTTAEMTAQTLITSKR